MLASTFYTTDLCVWRGRIYHGCNFILFEGLSKYWAICADNSKLRLMQLSLIGYFCLTDHDDGVSCQTRFIQFSQFSLPAFVRELSSSNSNRCSNFVTVLLVQVYFLPSCNVGLENVCVLPMCIAAFNNICRPNCCRIVVSLLLAFSYDVFCNCVDRH
jgi:hypothetical protein